MAWWFTRVLVGIPWNIYIYIFMIFFFNGCFQKYGWAPKMDGLFHGKTYENSWWFGWPTPIFGSTPIYTPLTKGRGPPTCKLFFFVKILQVGPKIERGKTKHHFFSGNTAVFSWATKKNPALLSMKYWLFNRGTYNGLWNNPHITGQYNPLYNPTN